jgi:myo-inositol-1(or 4)-monophosphatase
LKGRVYICGMIINTLRAAAEAGVREMQRYFNHPDLKKTVKDGGINDLVTEADHAADKAIITTIKAAYPDHFILSEETGNMASTSEYKWIIDPIDGTINFAHGIPICCVSVGVEKDGEMIAGMVYCPFINEIYFAEKGNGAFLNDQPIAVSDETDIKHACLVTGFPYTYLDAPNGPLQVFDRLVRKGVPVRRLGSAAIDLCWVAAGRFEGFFEHKLNAWDSAAGFLLVKEAGGNVTDFAGNAYSPYQPHIAASNGKIHEDLLKVVNNEHEDFKS